LLLALVPLAVPHTHPLSHTLSLRLSDFNAGIIYYLYSGNVCDYYCYLNGEEICDQEARSLLSSFSFFLFFPLGPTLVFLG
jgi:hypothetical protein